MFSLPATSSNSPKANKEILFPLSRRRAEEKDAVKIMDIRFALAVCNHTSLRSADHISDFIRSHGKGSLAGELRCHRTKVKLFLNKVVAEGLKRELKEDLGNRCFSILGTLKKLFLSKGIFQNLILITISMYYFESKPMTDPFLRKVSYLTQSNYPFLPQILLHPVHHTYSHICSSF